MKSLCSAQSSIVAASLPVRGAWIEIPTKYRLYPRGWSLPVRGAWIEMSLPRMTSSACLSLPVRGAWIEIFFCGLPPILWVLSLPVRGAWIEISCARTHARYGQVAPRAGSVD